MATLLHILEIVYCSPKILSKKTSRQEFNVCKDKSIGDFVPHPTNCRMFYLCTDSGPVDASCPNTMLFNPITLLCDVGSKVECNTNVVESSTIGSTTNRPPVDGGSNSQMEELEKLNVMQYCASLPSQLQLNRMTFIGSTINCQKYYICYYGQALEQKCSANLLWNTKIGKCDLPHNVKCRNNWNIAGGGDFSGLEEVSSSITYNEFINCPPYGQHIYPHMEKCDQFIFCVKGHAVLQQCPFYNHFDIISKKCIWKNSALCVRELNLLKRNDNGI